MPELKFRGGRIHYKTAGSGKAVVLLHGFLESHTMWLDFAGRLSEKYRVIMPDLPGHGRTSSFGYAHTMEFMAECVQHVIRSSHIRRYHLVGHSMGGYVGMAMAEMYPDKIRGICLLHSTASADSEEKKLDRERVIKLVQKDRKAFVVQSIPGLFNPGLANWKKRSDVLTREARQMSSQGIIAALEGMKARPDREVVLKFAPFPILVIAGRHDKILPWQKLKDVAALSRRSTFVLLEQAAHMGQLEEVEKCFDAVSGFLRLRY